MSKVIISTHVDAKRERSLKRLKKSIDPDLAREIEWRVFDLVFEHDLLRQVASGERIVPKLRIARLIVRAFSPAAWRVYYDRLRSISFNLRHSPSLQDMPVHGASFLASASSRDLWPERNVSQSKNVAVVSKLQATTDQFRCGKCGKRETTYRQAQTRSADEPMTTFITCVNCGNRWKE